MCLGCTENLFQDAAGKEEVRGSRRAEENWKNKNMPCVSIPKGVSSRSTRNIPRKAQLQRLRFSYDWNNSHLCVTCWQNCWLVFYHVFQDFRICLCQNPEAKHSEDIYCSACKNQFCLNWLLWFVLSLLFTFYFLICGVQPLWILKLAWGLKNQDMDSLMPQMQQDMVKPIITDWYEQGIVITTTRRSL